MNELPINNNQTKDINIINYLYNEEFISLINKLSSCIKEYYYHYQLYINNIKAQTESLNEQTLFSKSSINDILMYLNQSKPKLSINTSENYIREKAYSLSDRMEKVNEIKRHLTYNSNNIDIAFNSFFEEAKDLFKKMKRARSNKIEELTISNYEEYVRKTKDKASSHSPNAKLVINKTRYNCNNMNTQNHSHNHAVNNNNISTQLNSSFNSSQRVDSFNTFGSNPSNFTGNVLTVSIDDIIKKNESLISEITLSNYKYKELSKDNEHLRNMIMKLKQEQHNSLINLSFKEKEKDINKDKEVVNQQERRFNTKSHSLSKKTNPINNSTECEPVKESKINSKKISKEMNNYLLLTCPPAKDSKIIKHKRAHSIDNTSTINNSNSNQRNPLIMSSNSTNTIDNSTTINNNPFKTLNNSHCGTNNMPMSRTLPSNNNRNNYNSDDTNSSVAPLASLVITFLSQMKLLQESISNHSNNVKEMKRLFEIKKRELTKLAEFIIESSSIAQSTTLSQTMQLSKSSNISMGKQQHSSSSSTKKNNDLQITKLESELNQLKASNLQLEKTLIQEREQLSQSETKFINEKTQNASLKEFLNSVQSQLEEMKTMTQEQKKTITQLEQSNSELNNSIQKHKEMNKEHDTLMVKYELIQKQYSQLEIESNKLSSENTMLTEEVNILKEEISKLKQTLIESNQNMTTISKTNEVILNEKDNIIKNMSNNTLELKKEIEGLTHDLKLKTDSISSLQLKLQSMESASNDMKQSKTANENKEMISLKVLNEKYKNDYNQSKKENKELMNRIAELKISYLSFNEEKENLKQKLIEINEEADASLKEFQQKNRKLQSYKEEYSNRLNEKIKDKAYNNLKYSSEEYINTLAMIKKYNGEMKDLNRNLEEKIQKSLDNNNTEIIDKIQMINLHTNNNIEEELVKETNSLMEEKVKMKSTILTLQNKENQSQIPSNNNNKDANNPNKTLSDINEQNSNFINDELSSVSGIFLEDKNDEGEKKEQNQIEPNNNHPSNNSANPSQNIHPKQCMSLPNIVHNEQLSIERKHSQSSLHSNDELKYQSTLKMMEENETLFRDQLNTIKRELKSTIEERNQLKRKCEESASSSVMTKDELFKILKQTFEKLIDLIQVVGKVKDYVMMILKLLNYTDEEIQKIITKKDKKTLFGIFK